MTVEELISELGKYPSDMKVAFDISEDSTLDCFVNITEVFRTNGLIEKVILR